MSLHYITGSHKDRQFVMLTMYAVLGYTLEEIGNMYGITKQRAGTLVKDAKKYLRKPENSEKLQNIITAIKEAAE